MSTPRALILRAPGTNCDQETVHAFERAGGLAESLHVNRLLENPAAIDGYQILCIPGGFSYGDDIAAGRIFANQLRHYLADALHQFNSSGKLILGICNGFQVLLKSGLLTPEDSAGPVATLAWNDSGKFEDRWVHLRVTGKGCVFLTGLQELELPVAHAEGKFVTRDDAAYTELEDNGQLVLRYHSSRDSLELPHAPYPDNPNGSRGDVAGLCDASGRVLGLMPHPERFTTATQHPRWTREPWRNIGDGLAVFQNAVRFFL